ncbi:MAG: lasso peptide biosynthesis PqqD family chaperone [Bacteroidales bacterium]|nr:lasso peptide biosynthesis PqqD family chaperone [Bacteroidales bacterium]
MGKHILSLQSIIKRNPEMISSDMDGETVMMSMENGEYYGLDPIGSRIWAIIENETKIEDLIIQLLDEFEVEREQCEEETLSFINDLSGKNLLIIL